MHFKNTNTKSAQYEKFHDAYKKITIILKKKNKIALGRRSSSSIVFLAN